MARREATPQEEQGTVGEWIVTFSDCMTLLLCFFVLLLTFSSFDDAALQRFGGAFNFDSEDSVIEESKVSNDSMMSPIVHMQDRSRTGSEIPTDSLFNESHITKLDSVSIPQDDAYRDKKVIRIPAKKLFAPASNSLSPQGKKYLTMMAGFLRKLPCRVIVSEAAGPRRPAGSVLPRLRTGLSRAWAVVDYLTGVQGLDHNQFNVSATHLEQAGSTHRNSEASVEIVLLARKVYE